MTTIEDLSPEMLVEIFSHYIRSEGFKKFQRNVVPVCKTWLSLSSVPSLWKSVNIRDLKYAVSLSKRGLLNNTKTLNFYRWPSDPRLPMTLLSNVRHLKSLKISQAEFSLDIMFVAKLCPNLEHLHIENIHLSKTRQMLLKELNPILTKCGPKLKHLSFIDCGGENDKELVTEIAAKCPNLEVFEWANLEKTKFPIYKLASGCPRLQKLVLISCEFVTEGEEVCSGFRDLTMFKTEYCNFNGLDVCPLLKNSNNLEHLQIQSYENLISRDFSKISSNKVRFLNVYSKEIEAKSLKTLKELLAKFKRALSHYKKVLKDNKGLRQFSPRLREITLETVLPLSYHMQRGTFGSPLFQKLCDEGIAKFSLLEDDFSMALKNSKSSKASIREGRA